MKNIFGLKKTVLDNEKTINEAILSLSDESLQILDYIATKLKTGNYDHRGVPVSYDKTQLSIFTTFFINEIRSSGLLTEHPDSKNGTSFFFMNKDVVECLIETGNHYPT